MAIIKGGFQRLLQTFLYLLCFCCAGIILGVYSYFLSVLANRDLPIARWKKAVEGLSGVACVYTIFAVLLTCCLGGISFFGFLAIVLDVCMIGAFIAMAILTRDGADSCKGNVQTPLGNGPANNQGSGYGSNGFGFGSGEYSTYFPNLGLACKLNTAAFAVSIIGAVLFIFTALMQVALVRHHKKEKRFGPSPDNNYTSGSGRRRGLFGRKNKNAEKEAELGAVGAGVPAASLAANHHDNLRPSHDTAYTGSTVAGGNGTGLVKDTDPAYDQTYHNTQVNSTMHGNHAPHGSHGGYYTAPTGTGANPYGYDSSIPTNAAAGNNF